MQIKVLSAELPDVRCHRVTAFVYTKEIHGFVRHGFTSFQWVWVRVTVGFAPLGRGTTAAGSVRRPQCQRTRSAILGERSASVGPGVDNRGKSGFGFA